MPQTKKMKTNQPRQKNAAASVYIWPLIAWWVQNKSLRRLQGRNAVDLHEGESFFIRGPASVAGSAISFITIHSPTP